MFSCVNLKYASFYKKKKKVFLVLSKIMFGFCSESSQKHSPELIKQEIKTKY